MTRGGPAALAVPRHAGWPADVRAAFTDREIGNVSLLVGGGDVAGARVQALQTVGASLQDAVFCEQVHGARVAVVGRADRGRGAHEAADVVAGADALVTTDEGTVVAILTADCVPLLLAGPERGVAAVHAGRRGIESGVVGAAVAVLSEVAGCAPREVHAAIGPAIGGCCYEVPEQLVSTFSFRVPSSRTTTTWGTPALDVVAAVRAQLAAADVERVVASARCTRCHRDCYFSHRAAADGLAEDGRQAALVVRGPSSLAGSGQPPTYT